MADKDLKRTSYTITAGVWCYETHRGIEIYKHDPDGVIRNFTISWRYLRNALKRKDK